MEFSNRSAFRERRRSAILDAVVRVLSRQSYELMTMDSVAREAEMTKPTLYAYFDSKEALLAEAIGRRLESAADELCRLNANGSPREAIVAFAAWAIEHRFLDGDALPGSPSSHQIAAPFRQSQTKLTSRMEEVLFRARDEDRLDPMIDISIAARFLLTSIHDFNLRDPEKVRDFEKDRITFLRLIQNALFPLAA